jgi:hypothetical protein
MLSVVVRVDELGSDRQLLARTGPDATEVPEALSSRLQQREPRRLVFERAPTYLEI